MLGQAKPFASLSSTLLARKGQARPAMRPQGFASLAPSPQALEDLGWNDMGTEGAATPTPIMPTVAPVIQAPPPPVVAAQEALREEFEPDAPDTDAAPVEASPVVRSVSVATAGRLQRETAHKGRAAFTLRLDAERHLKLRLAVAVTHRSAQLLVTHALDQYLAALPAVGALVAQLPETVSPKRKR